MAIFNEILVGRFNRYLQKLTAIKATPPTPALSTEIQPSLDLNSIPQEDRYLLGLDTFWVVNSSGPTAGQSTGVRLRNPVGSNVIAVVEFIGFWESVADVAAPGMTISYQRLQPNDLSSSATVPALDSRTSRIGSVCISSAQTNVGAQTNILLTVPEVSANSFFGLTLYEAMGIPLLPGSAVQVNTTAVNTHLEVSMKWRERFLEDSERA